MTLRSLTCTHCLGAGLELQPDGQVICRFCGTVNEVEGVVCPHCEHVNPVGAESCANCHRAMQQACPQCGTSNSTGAETCRQCGSPLDAVAHLSTRWGGDPANRFNQQQRDSAQIKAQEASDGERRMAELQAIEQRRLALLDQQHQQQARRQRQMMQIVGVGVAAFVLFVIVAVVLTIVR